MLKPQDIVVLSWLIIRRNEPWRYIDIAYSLALSQSEAHAAVHRLSNSGLLVLAREHLNEPDNLQWSAVEKFLLYGVRYAFYGERGPISRGKPTGVAAPPLREHFSMGEEIPVWPDPEGEARGYELRPLYKTVPIAARRNPELYEILALIDALRDGRARERQMAEKLLKEKLNEYAKESTEY